MVLTTLYVPSSLVRAGIAVPHEEGLAHCDIIRFETTGYEGIFGLWAPENLAPYPYESPSALKVFPTVGHMDY